MSNVVPAKKTTPSIVTTTKSLPRPIAVVRPQATPLPPAKQNATAAAAGTKPKSTAPIVAKTSTRTQVQTNPAQKQGTPAASTVAVDTEASKGVSRVRVILFIALLFAFAAGIVWLVLVRYEAKLQTGSAPTLTITATPSTVEYGSATLIQWTASSNATGLFITGVGDESDALPSGSTLFFPSQTETAAVTATGNYNDLNTTLPITVNPTPVAPTFLEIILATPPLPGVVYPYPDNGVLLVNYPQSSTTQIVLMWNIANASYANISFQTATGSTTSCRVSVPFGSYTFTVSDKDNLNSIVLYTRNHSDSLSTNLRLSITLVT